MPGFWTFERVILGIVGVASMVFLATLMTGCDGGGHDDGAMPRMTWSGSYAGTLTYQDGRPVYFEATLVQEGAEFAGTLLMLAPSADPLAPTRTTGTLIGTINGDFAFVTYTPDGATQCPLQFTMEQDEGDFLHETDIDEVTGTFVSFNCTEVLSGTLEMHRI